MRTYEELVKDLDAKIPREAISTREAGNGRRLDYLSGYYVIDRLNKVLGPGNWAYEADSHLVHQGIVPSRSGDTHSVHYLSKVRLVVTIGGKPTEFRDYGYGDGTDKTNPGKAHELAVKESVTDGLKRCAKNLGMSFGLALYSKDQENVDEGQQNGTVGVLAETRDPSRGEEKSRPIKRESSVQAATEHGLQKTPRKTTLEKISLTSKVIIDSKRASQEEVVKLLTAYGVKSKEELSDEQATKLLTQLEEKLK